VGHKIMRHTTPILIQHLAFHSKSH
jgi:hypothetical protein